MHRTLHWGASGMQSMSAEQKSWLNPKGLKRGDGASLMFCEVKHRKYWNTITHIEVNSVRKTMLSFSR